MPKKNGAQALIETLVNCGVDTCFTNPGTSEMHFVAALDSVPEMRGVLALFEGVATGAADGFARVAGRPDPPTDARPRAADRASSASAGRIRSGSAPGLRVRSRCRIGRLTLPRPPGENEADCCALARIASVKIWLTRLV